MDHERELNKNQRARGLKNKELFNRRYSISLFKTNPNGSTLFDDRFPPEVLDKLKMRNLCH